MPVAKCRSSCTRHHRTHDNQGPLSPRTCRRANRTHKTNSISAHARQRTMGVVVCTDASPRDSLTILMSGSSSVPFKTQCASVLSMPDPGSSNLSLMYSSLDGSRGTGGSPVGRDKTTTTHQA